MGGSDLKNSSETRGPGRPRDEEARRRILNAAETVLEEEGFANATIEAIAEKAGASRATIYRWWPNRAAVLIEAFRETMASELPFPDTGSLEDDIRLQLMRFMGMLIGSRGRIFAAFIAGAQTDPDVAEAFRQMWIAPRRADAKRALEKHRDSGALPKDIDLDLAVELVYAPLYFRLLTGYGKLTRSYVEALTKTALKGLQSRP